jgi:hypothetical protein
MLAFWYLLLVGGVNFVVMSSCEVPVEVEVPLGPGAAEVSIPAKVEVPLGSSAAVVPMAAAEPGGCEVLLRLTDPPFLDSSKFHAPTLPCSTIPHVLHTQTKNRPYIS